VCLGAWSQHHSEPPSPRAVVLITRLPSQLSLLLSQSGPRTTTAASLACTLGGARCCLRPLLSAVLKLRCPPVYLTRRCARCCLRPLLSVVGIPPYTSHAAERRPWQSRAFLTLRVVPGRVRLCVRGAGVLAERRVQRGEARLPRRDGQPHVRVLPFFAYPGPCLPSNLPHWLPWRDGQPHVRSRPFFAQHLAPLQECTIAVHLQGTASLARWITRCAIPHRVYPSAPLQESSTVVHLQGRVCMGIQCA
jgi:hypothetical protein